MRTKLLKISVLTAALIFLFTSASWADDRKNRHHNHGQNKQIRNGYDRNAQLHRPSHANHSLRKHDHGRYKKYHVYHQPAHHTKRHYYKHHYKNHRPGAGHHRYHKKAIRKHQHRRKSPVKVFYIGSVFEPGWSVIVKTKSRW